MPFSLNTKPAGSLKDEAIFSIKRNFWFWTKISLVLHKHRRPRPKLFGIWHCRKQGLNRRTRLTHKIVKGNIIRKFYSYLLYYSRLSYTFQSVLKGLNVCRAKKHQKMQFYKSCPVQGLPSGKIPGGIFLQAGLAVFAFCGLRTLIHWSKASLPGM